MRTQIARVMDTDDASWRLPRVDPAGWLARRPAGVSSPRSDGSVDHVRGRRPRRTEAARVARERELARRRRRRQGRSLVVGRVAVHVTPAAKSPRRPVEPVEREGYRIDRWGRLALTILSLATFALIAVRVVAGLTAAAVEPVDVTVRPGDTLWSIAAQAAPDQDPRAVIDEIRELNQVSGDVVRVGEVLRVPASADRGSAE